jgi:hypothetical protein
MSTACRPTLRPIAVCCLIEAGGPKTRCFASARGLAQIFYQNERYGSGPGAKASRPKACFPTGPISAREACFWIVALYRLQKVVRRCRPRWLWMPIRLTLGVVDKLFTMVAHANTHANAPRSARACSFLMVASEYTATPRLDRTAQSTRYVPLEQGLDQAELP